jgi:predicted O-methyltransferase YrrM
LVKKNGLVIIDNVLWHGEVVDEKSNDKFTNIIRNFNKHVKEDKNTEQVILPLGDGLTVSRKL